MNMRWYKQWISGNEEQVREVFGLLNPKKKLLKLEKNGNGYWAYYKDYEYVEDEPDEDEEYFRLR